MRGWITVALLGVGCRQIFGISDPTLNDASSIDAKTVLVLSGTTKTALGSTVGNVAITWLDSAGKLLASTTSDSAAAYRLEIPFAGAPLAGQVHLQRSGYLDAYYEPETELTSDMQADLYIVTQSTYDTLCQAVGVTCDQTLAWFVAVALNESGAALAGVTVSSAPSGTVKYDGANNFPSSTATVTGNDGQAYSLNLPPGTVSLDAMMTGFTFTQHAIACHAHALTVTSMTGRPVP